MVNYQSVVYIKRFCVLSNGVHAAVTFVVGANTSTNS